MKTYKPTNDEFYDGFEYLENGIKKVYRHQIQLDNIEIITLSGNDLSELGFTLIHQDKKSEDGVSFFKTFYGSPPFAAFINLMFEKDVPYVTIKQEDTVLVNKMHIKNISELKWILNRYGLL